MLLPCYRYTTPGWFMVGSPASVVGYCIQTLIAVSGGHCAVVHLGNICSLLPFLPLTYLYSSAPILMPLFAIVGLLASVIRLCIQAMIGSVASVIGCFLFWVPSDWFAAFLEGLSFVVLLSRHFLCHMGDPWWPTWPLLHCLPLPCRSAYHIALRTTLLYPTRLLGFMHCFCLHFGISLTKFLGSVHRRWRHNVIPCQVPCTAAVGTLSYRAGLLRSLLCCGGHIVMPCQVAGFHALLVGEHCCNRLLSSVQCCCVRLSFSVCYCRVLCGICHVWYHNT